MRLNASPGARCSAPLALLLCATDLLPTHNREPYDTRIVLSNIMFL